MFLGTGTTFLFLILFYLTKGDGVEENEQQWIESLRAGDERVFRTLYAVYYHRLFCIARQYVHDAFIAETIVSDLFLHLWECRPRLDIHTSLNAYLIRMVRNFSLNYLQKNYVEREVNLEGVEKVSPLLFLSADYPLGQLLEKELAEKLRKAIDGLPAETRRVFVLSRLEELKQEEVAKRLEISVNTVKYHMKQALGALRIALKDYLITLLFGGMHFF